MSKFDVSPKIGCDSLTVFLTNFSDSATSFRWDMGDGVRFPVNKEVHKYLYEYPGEYTISLSLVDSNACNITDDSSLIIQVLPTKLNKVNFKLSYKKGCSADGIISLKNIINTSELYIWEFSDGTMWDNKSLPFYTTSSKGDHSITLTSKDTGLCTTNTSFSREYYIDGIVPAIDGITLYNVFSPDSDDFNKCFTIDIAKSDCIDLKYDIYNRWGERVYEGVGIDDCWDGVDYRSGKKAPEGEYFGIYLFTVQDSEKDHR